MISLATSADVPRICGLWNDVIARTTITFTSTPKAESDIARLMETQPVFLAPEGQGFATYGPFRSGDGYRLTSEHAIYLTPDARGHGLGRAVMSAVEDHARAAGTHSLIAGISGENDTGVAFHAAMGFVTVGRIPEAGHKFGRFLDLILMQKRL